MCLNKNVKGTTLYYSTYVAENVEKNVDSLYVFQCKLDLNQAHVVTAIGSISTETAVRLLTGLIVNDGDT